MDFDIDRTPGFKIGRTSHLLQTEVRNGLNEAGMKVSPEGLSILLLLHSLAKPIRVTDLARLAVRDATTLKRQVDGLVKLEYAIQEKDTSDRRVVLVSVTENGASAVELITPILKTIREKALHGLTRQEVTFTLEVLDKIQMNLLHSNGSLPNS